MGNRPLLLVFLFCVYQGEAISTIFCRNQPLCGPFEVLNYKEISELVFASQAQIGKTTGCNILCNTDFEDDILVGLGNFGFFHEDRVTCWGTTATDRQIEIWGSGFGGVPAYSGNQFAELNANMVSTLYQEFDASPGSSVTISFAHRGRAGIDALQVEIGPLGGPYVNLGEFSAGTDSWVYNTVNYAFPKTIQSKYTLRFKSVRAAGGATVGNFLDAISITLSKPITDFSLVHPVCPQDSAGSIAVHIKGGLPPYTFNWLPPINSTDSIVSGLLAGVYKVEIRDFYGCGEDVTFDLTSKYGMDSTGIRKQVCSSFFWPVTGNSYDSSGRYPAHFTNVHGCDSVIILDLEVLPSYKHEYKTSACGSYLWQMNGINYTKSGVYTFSKPIPNGCDSVFILDLQILPIFYRTEIKSVCDYYVWPVNEKEYRFSGVYYDSLQTSSGCDSIIQLDLVVSNSFQKFEKEVHCEFYTWKVNQVTYTESGIYTTTFKTTSGCDSIYTLDLTIHPKVNTIESHKSCNSYTWPLNGITYFKTGTYSYTLSSSNGCDSVILLELEIYPNYQKVDTVKVCEEYFWPANGKSYSASGLYHVDYNNQFGCDSNFTLYLTILKSNFQKQIVTSCKSFNWTVTGLNYQKSGVYEAKFINKDGCDSIILLDLTIYPEYFLEENVRVCDAYFWPVNGREYTHSGVYKSNYLTKQGCDSIYILNLAVDKSFIIYDTIQAIESYTWPVNREVYKESGTYNLNFQTKEGCDSMHILILEIKLRGEIFVPNVFSPNGDGVNDHFTIYSSPEIRIIDRLRLYNRWGELMFDRLKFEPNVGHNGWDGYFKEQPVIPGVFVYVVEWTDLKGDRHAKSGDATLVR